MEDPQAHRVYIDAWKKNKYDISSIGIYDGSSPFDLVPVEDAENPVLTRESVSDVPAVFVADPFLVKADGRWHVFFEVLNWQTDKGEIALATSEAGLEVSAGRPPLNRSTCLIVTSSRGRTSTS